MNFSDIKKALEDRGWNAERIRWFETIDSTNRFAISLGTEAPHGTLIAAEQQTEGRGRRGRSFYSPSETGIYMTVIFDTGDFDFTDGSFFTTAAAVMTARAIDSFLVNDPSEERTKIKWVNDIYFHNKKICGILAEAVMNPETMKIARVILGIGINVSTENFPEEIGTVASSICPGGSIDRAELIGEIYDRLMRWAENYRDRSFMKEYRERCYLIGQRICYYTVAASENQDSEVLYGTAVDITDEGELVIDFDTDDPEKVHRKTVNSGECSVRLC